jgi:hypothetical protein
MTERTTVTITAVEGIVRLKVCSYVESKETNGIWGRKRRPTNFLFCRFFFEQRTRRNTSMSRPHDEEYEFKEFIDQINALQQMQGTEQEELNQQRRLNVDLMEDLVKCSQNKFKKMY